jgi:SWI/SNF-related matrix-associated actin-dependent regulator 1 of chromatin subfamily A
MATLVRQYQLAGVEYHMARDNALFGDAPGLGKTAECILLSNAIRAKRTLVVCPASLRLKWEREIWQWSTQENVSTYPILKSRDGVSLEADYVITSYALLLNKGIRDAILDARWDHLILDEAHAIKDPKGNKRTRVICAPDMLPSVVGRITMASGTILPNQPVECYNAVRLLNWEAIDRASLNTFKEHYYDFGGGTIFGPVFDPKTQTWSRKVHWSEHVRNVPRNLDDLQYRLRKHIMVRRLKEDVLKELPRKQWLPFPLESTGEIKKALKHEGWKAAERLWEMDLDAFKQSGGFMVDGSISTARRLLGEAKAPQVAEYARELLASGVEKLVIGAWHLSVLAYLREQLEEYGLEYIDGSTTPTKKQQAIDFFQNERDSVAIILGQMMVLGEGCDLFVAQDVLLAEPDWVPGRNDQFLDRIHRLGQKGDHVIGHLPVVPGTLDEKILSVAIRKDRAIYEALDAKLEGEG